MTALSNLQKINLQKNVAAFIRTTKNMMRCAIWYYCATLLKLKLLYGCFSCFLNCTNATKSRNAPQIC